MNACRRLFVDRSRWVLQRRGGGRTQLSVHCDTGDWVARAKQVLNAAGDIAAAGEVGAAR
jgi:hypothetical protein